MIFRIKHSWRLTLLVAIPWAAINAWLGAFEQVGEPGLMEVLAWGAGGALVALAINGVLHEALKRVSGERYRDAFDVYGKDILDGMHWPAYLSGGFMAAVAEEPFFRGVLLPAFDQPVVGVAVAALVFAACHWLRVRHFGFWLWALWEGILFGILMVVTGSLWVPMIAHGLHDVIAYRVFAGLIDR